MRITMSNKSRTKMQYYRDTYFGRARPAFHLNSHQTIDFEYQFSKDKYITHSDLVDGQWHHVNEAFECPVGEDLLDI